MHRGLGERCQRYGRKCSPWFHGRKVWNKGVVDATEMLVLTQ